MCTRKSLSIPKSSQRAPPAGILAKEAVGKTAHNCGQFTAWLGHKGSSEVTYFIPQPPDQAVLLPGQQGMAKSSQSRWRQFFHSSAQLSLSSTQTL